MASFKIRIKNFIWRQTLKYLVNPKKIVKINVSIMFLDSKDSLLLSIRKNYEKKHVDLIKKIIKPGDYVLDIGAHIGYFTLLFAKLVKDKGKVFAFEPDKENFRILEKNIKTNGYQNVILYQKAVSDKNEKLKIIRSDINTGATKTLKIKKEKTTEIEIVEGVKLDDYLKDYIKKISFFKMDVEGSESLALKGMRKILNNKNLKFTIEFFPNKIEELGQNSLYLLKFIKSFGFKIYDLDRDLEIKDIKELVNFYKRINYFTKLYCSRTHL